MRGIDWFGEISNCAQIPAKTLVVRAMSAHKEDRNVLGKAQGSKRLTQLEAGQFRHHQIQQDRVGFVSQGHQKSILRITCIGNLVSVFKALPEKMPYRLIIIYDQDSRHDF